MERSHLRLRVLSEISAGDKEHNGKQDADDPGTDLDFLNLAGEELDQDIGKQTECDAIGDIIGKRHKRNREESGDSGGRIAPIDILDAADHKDTDINQGRGRGAGGNQRGDGR